MANEEIEKKDGEEGDGQDPNLIEKDEDGNPIDPTKKEGGEQHKVEETPEARKSRLERQLEQHKKKHPELYQAPTEKTNGNKSDGLDYGQKAFLATNGIKGADELAFFQKELKQSGQDMEELLNNEYFQGRLETFREEARTANANPRGKREGGGAPVDSVEFWATKPIDEVPMDMRAKVVNFKLAKEKNEGVFYNSGPNK